MVRNPPSGRDEPPHWSDNGSQTERINDINLLTCNILVLTENNNIKELHLLQGSAEYNVMRQLQSKTREQQCLQKVLPPSPCKQWDIEKRTPAENCQT